MTMINAKYEVIITTATRLFNAGGYHRTGVDSIMRESGVSKTTMYKYFPTKEDLILEILKRKSNALIDNMTTKISNLCEKNPHATSLQKILIVLDVIEAWIKSDEFCGCLFMKAVSEYDGKDKTIRQYAKKHKEKIRELILNVLDPKAEDASNTAKELAQNIAMIIDGAIVTAYIGDNKDIIKNVRKIVSSMDF